MKLISPSVIILCTVLFYFSCSKDSSNDNGQNPGTQNPPSGTSVETNPPNANYPPAFAGQTRIGSVSTTTPYRAIVITSALTSPWGIATLPDGRLLVTQKSGSLRIVTVNGTVSNSITGLPPVNASGQGGLLGLCIDPAFASNRMIYWVFSENLPAGAITSVAKGRLSVDETTVEAVTVIYRSNYPYNGTAHYGGRVIFDNTGNLLVSIGERSDIATRTLAQSVNRSLGKVMRIATNGQPAAGNPAFTQAGALPELYSMGHRNPQGLAKHPVTGEIWQSEHGPRGGDEINRLQAGANFGWPVITYGIEYGGQTLGAGIQQQIGMEQPVYYWDPVISPSGMTFYKGNAIPEWQNNLFIATLSGMHIDRLVIENNRIVGEERLLTGEGQRFRDITQGTDNLLYAITDGGRLYRIEKL